MPLDARQSLRGCTLDRPRLAQWGRGGGGGTPIDPETTENAETSQMNKDKRVKYSCELLSAVSCR